MRFFARTAGYWRTRPFAARESVHSYSTRRSPSSTPFPLNPNPSPPPPLPLTVFGSCPVPP